jgi:hypothetical protein
MGWWGMLAVVPPLAIAVVREFLTLRRDVARRDSIVRLVATAPTDLRIIDRASDGGLIEIIVNKTSEPIDFTEDGQNPSRS